MPSKKHLRSSQGSSRSSRRRTIQLSEFLRGEDEDGVQQSNEGSIAILAASCVTATPVVTPDTTTDDLEKVAFKSPADSPPQPPPSLQNPANVWPLSFAEREPPQQAFSDLGKQVKKVKALALPEAKVKSLSTARSRGVGPVLPKAAAAGRDQAVARWLSSVPSPFDRSQPTSFGSPPRINILKRPTSQQPEETAATAALELGTSQQRKPPKSPGPSSQKLPENPSELVEIQPGKEDAVGPASPSSTEDQPQGRRSRSFWEESDDDSSVENQLPAAIRSSLLNAKAKEFRPERQQEQLHPAGESPKQLKQRRHLRTLKRRQLSQVHFDSLFESQGQSQAPLVLPSCYHSAPPAAAAQQRDSPVAAPPPTPPGVNEDNAEVSQLVFQMESLSSSGELEPKDISSANPLPSSISGPSQQLNHTLSSSLAPQEKNQPETVISQDLFYSRSLLDMDREDTQEEEQQQEEEQASPLLLTPNLQPEAGHQQQPKLIFQSPNSHGQDYPQPDLNCVPHNLKKLHKTVTQRYSDYAFVYALSAQLGQECVPMDCYVYLKMALLASLVSIEPDELRPPISLCIIATDSLMAHRLMNSIGQLAPRFVGPHEYGLQPTVNGGQLSSVRYNWVVASPLLMAQQGVYYVGDWTRLAKEQSEQIEKSLENGSVAVPQLQTDQALEAAIWMHWQPENSSNQSLTFAKLCPIFGLPIYMGDGLATSKDSLWSFLLRQHSKEQEQEDEQPDGLNIPEEDMRMLLHLLNQRQVNFEEKAQHMLQKYYVIARKERPTVFTSKTYIVLKQFAESFAKLALRLEVLESDVCVAIFHCEHFVQHIFGGISQPPPAVKSFSVISHIDPYMNEFSRWLLQYLDRYEDQELGMHKAKRRRSDTWEF